MAANSNYYGYSSGVQQSQVYGSQMQSPQVAQNAYGTQSSAGYGAQSTTAAASPYGSQQASQSRVMPQTPTGGYAPSAASGYPQTGSSYGYTARVQDSSSHSNQSYPGTAGHGAYSSQSASSYYERDNTPGPATSYDASKSSSYYGQQHSTPSQQSYGYGSSTPSSNKSMYSGQSHYSSPSNQGSGGGVQKSQTPSSVSGNVSYPYSRNQSSNYNQNSNSYSSSSNWSGSGGNVNNYGQAQGYDAAVYNAASSYFQQQQQQTPRQRWNKNSNNSNSRQQSQPRQKNPPKQQQVHYCEVCKISCAGPQTYKEHLEGQKHKKKEAAAKQLETLGPEGYKCSLCDVVCTGTEAFNAHMKGAKHLKTVKLHTKLGKPIPDTPSAEDQAKEKKKDEPKEQTSKSFKNPQGRRNRKASAPKITFIGGTILNTTNETPEQADSSSTSTPATPQEGEKKESPEAKETNFVGEEYVEEVKNDAGKLTGFQCKLCECKFNDLVAREAHLGGRRHKLSYKKKVQPDYVVENKPVKGRQQQHRPLMDDKSRQRWEQEMYWKKQEAVWRQEEARRWGEEEYWRRLEEEERMWEEQEHHEWRHRMGPPRMDFMPPDMFSPMGVPRPRQDSQDDRLIMSKHKQIYPNEQELTAVQNIVSAVEKALKLVSDSIADEDAPAKDEAKEEKMEVTEETVEEKTEEKKPDGDEEAKKEEKPKPKPEQQQPPRTLKGVMRVGVLAKGLLLHERLDVELVVLCQDRPTKQLLVRVCSKLPEQLTKVTDEKYDVSVDDSNTTLVVSSSKDPVIKIVIILTSPVMREEPESKENEKAEEQKDVLDREKCLEALASLRHAKWFQVRVVFHVLLGVNLDVSTPGLRYSVFG